MFKLIIKVRTSLILMSIAIPFLFSCVSTKNAVYFNNIQDSTIFASTPIPEHIIERNDLLSITISSLNPEASSVFNFPNDKQVRSSTPTGDVLEPAGYLVDKDGFIQLMMLGKMKVEGLTKKQLEDYIRTRLVEEKLLLDPVVDIRHLNFKVTVIGEVTRPTVITVPNEKITILEALGLAGDITIFGKRENVLVIREENGKKVIRRLDLNTAEVFQSEYYYLQSNDVVYVEPNTARVASGSRLNQLLPALLSGLSFAAIIFDRATRRN